MQNVSLWALGAGIASVASLWGGHRYRPLRALHRSSAMVLGGFVLVHLAGHVAGVFGLSVHQAVLDVLRMVYRQPVLEGVLLGCALFQGSSGLVLLWRGRGQRAGRVAWLQAWSGGYLALFLLVHAGAVLWGRAQGLDTNFHFAAAGLHVPPWQWFLSRTTFWPFWPSGRMSAALPTGMFRRATGPGPWVGCWPSAWPWRACWWPGWPVR